MPKFLLKDNISYYIDKMIRDYKPRKNTISELNLQEKGMYYTVKLITQLGGEEVANYVMVYTIDLISKESNKDSLIHMECMSFLG